MTYLQLNTLPKALTSESDIAKGQVGLQHVNPSLFLQLQLVKLHTHAGSDSRTLSSEATPEMVRGYTPREREEHGTATWSGTAASSGSISLTFGTAFQEVPTIIATISGVANANKQVTVDTPTTTGCTLYWKDDGGNLATSVPINWLAKGR